MRQLLVLTATFFNIGRIRFAPGTWTSLATMLLVYYIHPYWQAPIYYQLMIIAAIFLLGIPAAQSAEKHFKKKDPGQCVIDEVAGQMVALLWLPHKMPIYIAGFILFRTFDILKPPPIRLLERPPYGIGIMLDDIAAGLYALGLLHLGLFLYANVMS